MKTILLMRHAKAGEGKPSQSDFDRSLTDKGTAMARTTGKCLKSLGLKIDRVIASSAVRTQQTAEIVAAEVCPQAPIKLLESLYLAPEELFAQSIRQHPSEDESCALVVGHNPGIAALMCRWAEQSLDVPTATLAVFRSSATQWSGVRSDAAAAPRLISIIQKGQLVWQEPTQGVSAVPAE